MIDEREIVRRAVERQAPPEPAFERLLRRRARKRRNQRITAGVVGFAVFAAAVWIVARGGPLDRAQTPASSGPVPSTGPAPAGDLVGFVGLPPAGTTPSTPELGELVLSFLGRSRAEGSPLLKIFVYADGRLISWRESHAPEGANPGTYLEQRLTPEGVELLRSEVLSTGAVGPDTYLVNGHSGSFFWGTIQVREGDELVSVGWTTPYYAEDAGDPPGPRATREQASALEQVDALLADPAAWLPASAWADPEIRAYVPSRYEVCSEPWWNASTGPAEHPARILGLLPAPAADLLRAQDWTRQHMDASDQICTYLSTDQARALDQAIRGGGIEPDPRQEWRLEYRLSEEGIGGFILSFEAILPHGEALCSPCG